MDLNGVKWLRGIQRLALQGGRSNSIWMLFEVLKIFYCNHEASSKKEFRLCGLYFVVMLFGVGAKRGNDKRKDIRS